jgi:hypothetical protein
MYRAGVNTDQGGGVSWSYILRNPSLALLARRAPLGGIVAQTRLGSECLWRLTPRRALDEVDALIRRMWARPIPFRRMREHVRESAHWQVSQVHLAVDVANAPLEGACAQAHIPLSSGSHCAESMPQEQRAILQLCDATRY